ncbi:TPA: phage baseplate assembly protein [Burkholderia multivorans]|nr:phage baseplate assembly protein [Burkholderia multivorans]HEM7873375.1 phage baseplate assembly protein [Burkholderia multivorans]HEM7905384.1 phage baseplate assembly protein [Burkholderia multivorans]HEM8537575.1 phage baseplate assembly protein [Burkholderia multivorans]
MSMDNGIWNRLARRVLLLVGRARVKLVNDAGAVQLLQVQVNELETIDNLRRLAEFGFTSVPPKDSDVAIVFIGGDRSNGVVVATGHQASRPKGLNPGESMIYTQDGKRIYLTASGGIEIDAKGQPVTVDNASDVTWNCSGKFKVVAPGGVEFDTPTFSSTGDIIDNAGTNAHSMAQMRTIYNDHKHGGVQTGGGSTAQPDSGM